MMKSEQTEVQQFYSGSTVLITGGSGFLGKVLIEKLLRACPQLHQIVLLMRSKKGTESWQRLDKLLNEDIFKDLSQVNRHKVTTVEGDCQLPDLGLTNFDRQRLLDTVDIVFHVAASVKFNEGLAAAVTTNVAGTKFMLDLAREMTNLKAFVHVSTAFSNCDKDHIDEKFYPPKYNPDKLIRLTETVDEPYLSQLTPLMLGDSPNTYIYTKGVAEEIVRTHSQGLPVSVFRPSIADLENTVLNLLLNQTTASGMLKMDVMSTKSEPVPGWLDNPYGPAGLVVAYVTGVLRTMWCYVNKVAEVVPVDMLVNALIVTAWRTHLRFIEEKKKTSNKSVDDPQVFNYVSSVEQPLLWSQFLALSTKYHQPSVRSLWIPSLWTTPYKTVQRVLHVFLHLLPAYTIDTICRVFGVQTGLVKITRKLENMTDLLGYFVTHEWTFSNLNTCQLWLSLSPQDRKLFPFSFAEFDWDDYFKSCMPGLRRYLLKDDLSTLPRAVTKYKRFYWINNTLQIFLFYIIARYVWQLFDLSSVFMFLCDFVFTYD